MPGQQVRRKDALRDADRFRSLSDSPCHGLVLVEQGRIVDANSMLQERIGFSLEELRALSPRAWLHRIDREGRRLLLRHVRGLRRGEPPGLGFRIEVDDHGGSRRVLVVHLCPPLSQEPFVLQVLLIDVTERVSVVETMRQSEELFRAMFEASRDALFWADVKSGMLVRCNRAAEELLQCPREQLVGRHFTTLHPPEEASRVRDLFRRKLSGDVLGAVDVVLQRPDGVRVPASLTGSLITMQGRGLLQGAFRDETLTKAARQAQQEAREELERLVDERGSQLQDVRDHVAALYRYSLDGILMVDAEGRFEHGNPAAFRIFGWPPEEMIGAFFMKVVDPAWHDFMTERWNEVQRGDDGPYETVIVQKSGERRDLLVSHTRLTMAGEPKYAVVVKDVTTTKQAQRELEAYRDQLEQRVAQRTKELGQVNERLRRREEALNRAQEIAHVGSYEWHPATHRLELSEELIRIYGLENGAGKPTVEQVNGLLQPEDFEEGRRRTIRTLRDGVPLEMECTITRPDGDTRQLLMRGQRVVPADGSPAFLSGAVLDVTRQRDLERQVVETAQREQQRIGQDLHDSLGQELAGMALLARALEKQIETGPGEQTRLAGELAQLAGRTVRHARVLAQGLAPVDIAVGGLRLELERLCARAEELYERPCPCHIDSQVRPANRETATHLFFIAQEAVHNAMRHAGCSLVELRLDSTDGGRLTVQDNGQWREPPDPRKTGSGLRIMRHRAQLIGAKLHVDHATDGTRVVCTFPAATDPPGGHLDR